MQGHLRTWQYSPYVTDQWQVNRKLTLAIGTRWDYYPVPTRVDRGIEFYNFATNQYQICGKGGVPTDCGISVQKTLFLAARRSGVSSSGIYRASGGVSAWSPSRSIWPVTRSEAIRSN